ncbi:MAG: PRC-barrel domain-containing protein [Caldilineaceae bacterium]
MELTLNVDVEGPEGKLGRATYLIVNPISDETTHLVVRNNRLPHEERLLPTTWIKESNHERIFVDCTYDQWARLEPFVQTEYVKMPVPQYASAGFTWPYTMTPAYTDEYLPVEHKRIPVHTRELRRGSKVEASDGPIGKVEELIVDAANKHITHLVLSKGHLWGAQDIVAPVTAIKMIDDDRIVLNITKDAVAALPAVPIHRHATAVVS